MKAQVNLDFLTILYSYKENSNAAEIIEEMKM